MPRAPSVDPALVRAWLTEHPKATLAELREAFPALADTTARRWWTQRPPERPSKLAPVEDMAEDDVGRLVRTVRALHAALDRYSRELVDRDGRLVLDRDAAQAALAWQKTAAGLLAAHPGLLELVKAPAEGGDDDDISSIVDAIRGPSSRGADR